MTVHEERPSSATGPGVRPDGDGGGVAAPVVLAVDARSRAERRAVREWADAHHPGASVVAHDDHATLRRVLDPRVDRDVVPVRVTWLPDLHEAGVRPVHFLLLTNPRRPPGPLQALLGDRHRVTVGAPGRVAALHERFTREAVGGPADAFARFVSRQAVVACDVAERAVVGDRIKVPRHVVDEIAGSARFEARLAPLAEELGRTMEDLRAYGRRCLGELAAVQSPLGIDLYRAFMRPMYAKAWTVETEPERFAELRELNRRHALVFLPTHRSYVDPLVVQQALDDNDLPPNHILGGSNMAWWPLGPLGRRAGVVFIRRSFGDDLVYKLAIREFLGHLVTKRFNLEWYIEGGRTRTGKLRPPKVGLLRYLAEALEDDRAEDVMLVPMSIVYDRLGEDGALTAEQTGATKQREGLRWWAGYVRSQATHVGKARVHVGRPFLFREAVRDAGEGPATLDKVAFRICDAINDVTPVTATALVSLALLGSRGVALSLPQIEALSAPLLDYVERRGLRGPVAELRTRRGLQRGLDSLVDAGALERYADGTEPVWSVADGGHHTAAFYRNGALHHVLNRAIVEVALLRTATAATGDGDSAADPVETAWAAAMDLRDLLKFEFFFAPKERFRDQLELELDLLAPDWRDGFTGATARRILQEAPMVLADRVLRSFADAQLVVAERLAARDPRTAVERDAFVAECMAVGRQMLLQRRIDRPEAVGREVFDAALRLAGNRDLVDPGREDVRARREAWHAEVRALVDDLDALRAMDDDRNEELLRDDRP